MFNPTRISKHASYMTAVRMSRQVINDPQRSPEDRLAAQVFLGTNGRRPNAIREAFLRATS